MLNIHDLEKRHKKYKRDSNLPFIVLSTVVGATLIGATFFVLTYQKEEVVANAQQTQLTSLEKIPTQTTPVIEKRVEEEEKKDETNEATLVPKPIEANESIPSVTEIPKELESQKEQKRVVLTPSLEFISKMDANTPKNYSSEVISNTKVEAPATEKIKPVVIPPKVQEIKEEIVEPIKIEKIETPVVKEEKKGSVSISHRDEQKDIADVIKRFNTNHNPALSLFVAKKYYQIGDYEQAYNYALITNDINKNIEESWIIFAKSLMKLNKKEMAVETLKKYISHSSSSQAKQLLDEINAGKFR